MLSTPNSIRNEPWLESPLRTGAGELQLAGVLQNVHGLDPKAMRVLGSYSLIYMVNVDGYYCDSNGVRADLRTGDLVVIFPELAHAYGPKKGQPWTQVYLVFNGPQFDFLRSRGILDPARPVWHLEPVDYWSRRLEEVVAGDARHTEAAAMRAMGRFLHLVCDMAAADAEARLRPERDEWFDESQRLLGNPNGRTWLTPQQVAREVGLNYDNFRKQFALRLGLSPGQFQKRKRIDRACAAIYQGSHGFKELAEELEFCDVFHFSKAFKQVMGMTPSDFRKKAHGG